MQALMEDSQVIIVAAVAGQYTSEIWGKKASSAVDAPTIAVCEMWAAVNWQVPRECPLRKPETENSMSGMYFAI